MDIRLDTYHTIDAIDRFDQTVFLRFTWDSRTVNVYSVYDDGDSVTQLAEIDVWTYMSIPDLREVAEDAAKYAEEYVLEHAGLLA